MIANGGTLHADRRRPQLVFVHGKGESFRTQRSLLRGLIEDGLLLVVGRDMTDVEVTQKGLSAIDRAIMRALGDHWLHFLGALSWPMIVPRCAARPPHRPNTKNGYGRPRHVKYVPI